MPIPYDETTLGDPEDPGFKLARAGGTARSGGGSGVYPGGGPPPGPGGSLFSAGGIGPQGYPGFGSGDPQKRKKMLQMMMAAIQSMGGDSVPANLTPGEFVMNPVATAENGPMLERMNQRGNQQRGYFLGGLVEQIPGIGEPLSKAIDVAAPMAMQAMGVPAPLGAAVTNMAMHGGEADGIGEMLGNAGMSAGKSYLGGRLNDYARTQELESTNRANLSHLTAEPGLPSAPDGLGDQVYEDPRMRGYWDGGYVRPQNYAFGGPVRPQPMPGAMPQGPQANPYAALAGGAPRPMAGIPNPAPRPAPPAPTGRPNNNAWWTPEGAGGGMFGPAMEGGVFNPGGNPMAMQAAIAHLQRQGQADDRGDVNDLMSMNLGDPNMIAGRLMENRGARARDRSMALSGIAENSVNSAQDFYRRLAEQAYGGQLDIEKQRLAGIDERRTKQTKGKK